LMTLSVQLCAQHADDVMQRVALSVGISQDL